MGETLNSYRVLVGKPLGKEPHAGLRSRSEDSMKLDHREIGYGDERSKELGQVHVI
jgi:hypothetical protein